MDKKMTVRDLGMYVVVLPHEKSDGDDELKAVVLFLWLMDEYLHPDQDSQILGTLADKPDKSATSSSAHT
jgi:hypothetical protein